MKCMWFLPNTANRADETKVVLWCLFSLVVDSLVLDSQDPWVTGSAGDWLS